ncbi:MAG: pentapeptide repeat-containing protein [Armatimonadia bacterium]
METNEKPDWVNDVPERYGADWPEERRCAYVFRRQCSRHDRDALGRPCGYPTEDGQEYCLFHQEGDKPTDRLRREIQHAVMEGVHLSEANLWGADLVHTRLCYATLVGADLVTVSLKQANLGGANLSSADIALGDLSDAHLHSADLSNADLAGANFAGANLQIANLTGARLSGAKIAPNVDLDGVTWCAADTRPAWRKWLQVGEPMLRDELEAGAVPYDLHECERLYRQIKLCYQESGQYDDAGRFFVREMECKRKQLPRWSLMRPVYHVLHFLSDYFENPWRVVVIGAIVMLLWAVAQGAVGVHLPADGTGVEGPTVAGPGFGSFDWPSLQAFGRALYFSAITFTATGYGDYVPAHGWGQFLAATESLIGVFMMATFLVCLARKFGRA